MIATTVTAILSFVSTNIDDIFILMLLFAQETLPERKRQIVYGQYLGIFFTVAVSAAASWGLKLLSINRIGFLGCVPIGIGVREILRHVNKDNGEQDREEEKLTLEKGKNLLISVMLLAIANGADNLGSIFLCLQDTMPDRWGLSVWYLQ